MTLKEYEMQFEAYKFQQKKLDYRTASICSVIANVNRDPKKRKKPFKPQDFMPKEQKKRQKQTPEQMFFMVSALNKAFGGKGGK